MKNLVKKIAFGAVILGSLTSCTAYSNGYSNNDPNSYYNGTYDNGNYYAPPSYYGNGGYYANDGYYYRNNVNYQYDNNVPYYYGQNQTKIYVQQQVASQRPPNGLYDPNNSSLRNRQVRSSNNGQLYRNNTTRNSQSDGFRNAPTSYNSYRTQSNINRPKENTIRYQDNNRTIITTPNQADTRRNQPDRNTYRENQNDNGGGFRNNNTPQNTPTPTRTDNGRDGSR
jgi:hypothetical protein